MDFIELSRFEVVFEEGFVVGSDKAVIASISVAEKERFLEGERKEFGDKEGR